MISEQTFLRDLYCSAFRCSCYLQFLTAKSRFQSDWTKPYGEYLTVERRFISYPVLFSRQRLCYRY